MPKKRLYLESTEVPVFRTAGEIRILLSEAGARHIAESYDGAGAMVGMAFVLMIRDQPFQFKMPVRTDELFKQIHKRREASMGYRANQSDMIAKDRAQAARVAWRQLLLWLKSVLAMVDAGMAPASEAFLPYMQEASGQTVYEVFEEQRFKALPEGKTA